MNTEEILELLKSFSEVSEAYVLHREVTVLLNVGEPGFVPEVRIKIHKSLALPDTPFWFSVSHQVHTPTQMSPYFPSRTMCESEEEAIQQAIYTTTSFLEGAIREGHSPSEDWLVPNPTF